MTIGRAVGWVGGWLVVVAASAAAMTAEEWCKAGGVAVVSSAPSELLQKLTELPPFHATEDVPTVHVPRDLGGLEVGLAHGVLVVRPQLPGGLAERLLAGVEPSVAELLSCADSGADDDPASMARLVEGVQLLWQGDLDDTGRRKLRDLCYRFASAEVAKLQKQAECLANGDCYLSYCPDVPALPDGSKAPLYLLFLQRGPDDAGGMIAQSFWGPGHNEWQRLLTVQKGIIPVEEFRQRCLTKASGVDRPFPEDKRLDAIVQGAWIGQSPAVVCDELSKAAGLQVELAPAAPAAAITVISPHGVVRDLLPALACATGTVLCSADGGYRLQLPRVPAERLALNAPLPWWAAAQLTRAEAVDHETAWRDAMWAAFPLAERTEQVSKTRLLARLPLELHEAVARTVESRLGRRWTEVCQALPGIGSDVPLRLYRVPDRHIWEIACPLYSTVVGGWFGVQLDALAAGGEVAQIVRKEGLR